MYTIRPLVFSIIFCLLSAAGHAQTNGPPPGADVRLSGILISPTGRSALLNGQLTRVGDQLDGADVVAIREDSVRLRSTTAELTVMVGGNSNWAEATPLRSPREAGRPTGRTAPIGVSAGEDTDQHSTADSHLVAQGDTLSEIAERYLVPGSTLERMMTVLFESNREAFRGDIHRLRAGVRLKLPDAGDPLLHNPSRRNAALERARQQAPAAAQRQTEPGEPRLYGPIAPGQSLSLIAERIASPGFTVDQIMIALFEANPHAFGANINVLYAGALLRLPDSAELARRSAVDAALDVRHQMAAWRRETPAIPSKQRVDKLAENIKPGTLAARAGH